MECKNCDQLIDKNFCSFCGQKTNVGRLSLKTIFNQDILHGVFNLDRGLPKTWWRILTKPGTVAHEYIAGKRKRFYNFFYLLLILVGLKLYLNELFPEYFTSKSVKRENDFSAIATDNMRVWISSIVPILTFLSWLIYRRFRYNVLEHAIQATVTLIGVFTFFLLFNVLNIALNNYESGILEVLSVLSILISFVLFPLYSYYQFSSKATYTIGGKLFRSILFYLLFVFLIALYSLLFNWFYTGNMSSLSIDFQS